MLIRDYFSSSEISTKFPEVYVANNKKGYNLWKQQFVFVEEGVICHDLYDFTKDYTSEELNCRAIINPKSNNIRWLVHDEKPERSPLAATFVDANANNYAHWLSEVLPRVVLFCSDERFKNIPIVVNDGLHKNIMESLLIAAGYDREIFFYRQGKPYTAINYILYRRQDMCRLIGAKEKYANSSHGFFSAKALNKLHCNLSTRQNSFLKISLIQIRFLYLAIQE